MKLWIFGQSMCLPHGLNEEQGWPWLLSRQLNIDYKNFAQPGADNFFIYHTFLENCSLITQDDLVIIGWSHPNRKSFVLDDKNLFHQDILPNSLMYVTSTQTFFRSNNIVPSTKSKWISLSPQPSGTEFYDIWFQNYYSDYEQRCNFQSYLDSVRLRIPAQYIPFYFSQESISQTIRQNNNFMLEFIVANNVAISKNDFHMNKIGHQLWANFLLEKIQS